MFLLNYLLIILIILPRLFCKNETNPSGAEGKLSSDDDDDDDDEAEKEAKEEERNQQDIQDAVREVAYYLRSGKFNDFDRRYNLKMEEAKKKLYQGFPVPPLRLIHWEVKEYCQQEFLECLRYLQEKISNVDLKRDLDTTYVLAQQNWTKLTHPKEYNQTEIECNRLFLLDWNTAPGFAGPLERFQWRTSASYYMCWYTMNGQPELAHFGEPCDNLSHCLPDSHNGDIRAQDENEFACALYSFCPDPCCPNLEIINDTMEGCWTDPAQNPCYYESSGDHHCRLIRYANRDFASGVLNRWNLSCQCKQKGYQWDSRFGICIDIDECLIGQRCDPKTEECMNLPGKYTCICKWGYINEDGKGCVPNTILALAEKQHELSQQQIVFSSSQSGGLGEVFKLMFKKNNSNKIFISNKIIIICYLFKYF